MILVLKKGISDEEEEKLKQVLRSENCIIKEIQGVEETILGVVGKVKRDIRHFETLPGVAKVIPISKSYKLVSRELHPEPSVINVGDVEIGGDRLVVIAGPCAVEGRERTLEIARQTNQSMCCFHPHIWKWITQKWHVQFIFTITHNAHLQSNTLIIKLKLRFVN